MSETERERVAGIIVSEVRKHELKYGALTAADAILSDPAIARAGEMRRFVEMVAGLPDLGVEDGSTPIIRTTSISITAGDVRAARALLGDDA